MQTVRPKKLDSEIFFRVELTIVSKNEKIGTNAVMNRGRVIDPVI